MSNLKLLLKENIGMVSSPCDNLFSEELRRMEKYDNERLPQEMKEYFNYVKKPGRDFIDGLLRFGQIEFFYSREKLESMVAYGEMAQVWSDASDRLPFESDFENSDFLKQLFRKRKLENEEKKYFVVPHSVGLYDFSFMYCKMNDLKEAAIMGATALEGHYGLGVYHIGSAKLSFDDIENVANRRFGYIFGIPPVSKKEIVDTLVSLNNFPTHSSYDNIQYNLKERPLEELKPTRGASLFYDEAMRAREKGLFANVKTYELIGKAVPKPDPVIVGIDAFDQIYPMIYWEGDVGLGEKLGEKEVQPSETIDEEDIPF